MAIGGQGQMGTGGEGGGGCEGGIRVVIMR